jgi:ubiquinone/menaquinone biosynthesis C-methylase UbiE
VLQSPLAPIERQQILHDLAEQYEKKFVDKWDDLINWDKRQEAEDRFFERALASRGARKVLDAATGTGFHSVMLKEAGFDVTAVDGAAEMLDQAERNAQRRGLNIPFVHSDWSKLGSVLHEKYDAVVCLGSSFPHLFLEQERKQTLKVFYDLLKPGGTLIIDHRNFDAIRAHRYKSSGKYYYCGTGVSVSVDYVDATVCRFKYNFPDRTLHKLEVYPVLKNEMRELIEESGFSSVRTYGDFRITFDPFATDFYIHLAQRPN